MSEKQICKGQARNSWGGRKPCNNAATVGEYCKVHDPEAKRARSEARSEKLRDEWAKKNAEHAKTRRIHAAEQEVIRVAKWWAEQVSNETTDDKLMEAIYALEQEERS